MCVLNGMLVLGLALLSVPLISASGQLTNLTSFIKTANIDICPAQCDQDSLAPITTENTFTCCHCGCDTACLGERSCCPKIFNSPKPLVTLQQEANGRLLQCVSPGFVGHERTVVFSWMISRCLGDSAGDRALCEELDPMSAWESGDYSWGMPVYDTALGKTYRNKYCANCNNVNDENLRPWTPVVWGYLNDITASVKSILHNVQRKTVTMAFVNPFDSQESYCAIDRCNMTGQWETYDESLETACLSYMSVYVTTNGQVYRNIHCAICNGDTSQLKSTCHEEVYRPEAVLPAAKRLSMAYLNMDLVTENEAGAMSSGQLHVGYPSDSVHDAIAGICHEMHCSEGLQLVDGECKHKFRALESVKYRLTVKHSTSGHVPLGDYILSDFTKRLNGILSVISITLGYVEMHLIEVIHTYTVNVTYSMDGTDTLTVTDGNVDHIVSDIDIAVSKTTPGDLLLTEEVFRELSSVYDIALFHEASFSRTPFSLELASFPSNEQWLREKLGKGMDIYKTGIHGLNEEESTSPGPSSPPIAGPVGEQLLVPQLMNVEQTNFIATTTSSSETSSASLTSKTDASATASVSETTAHKNVMSPTRTSGTSPTEHSDDSSISETPTATAPPLVTARTSPAGSGQTSEQTHVPEASAMVKSTENPHASEAAIPENFQTSVIQPQEMLEHRRLTYTRTYATFRQAQLKDAFMFHIERNHSCPKLWLRTDAGIYTMTDAGLTVAMLGSVIVPVKKVLDVSPRGDVLLCVDDYQHIRVRQDANENNSAVRIGGLSWLVWIYGITLVLLLDYVNHI